MREPSPGSIQWRPPCSQAAAFCSDPCTAQDTLLNDLSRPQAKTASRQARHEGLSLRGGHPQRVRPLTFTKTRAFRQKESIALRGPCLEKVACEVAAREEVARTHFLGHGGSPATPRWLGATSSDNRGTLLARDQSERAAGEMRGEVVSRQQSSRCGLEAIHLQRLGEEDTIEQGHGIRTLPLACHLCVGPIRCAFALSRSKRHEIDGFWPRRQKGPQLLGRYGPSRPGAEKMAVTSSNEYRQRQGNHRSSPTAREGPQWRECWAQGKSLWRRLEGPTATEARGTCRGEEDEERRCCLGPQAGPPPWCGPVPSPRSKTGADIWGATGNWAGWIGTG